MPDLTPETQHVLADVAQRHGFSFEAALTLFRALAAHGGTMAQFSHPELGGMGQWSAGGMVMVGDMFNHDLKQRVDALCSELADDLQRVETTERRAGSARTQIQVQGQEGPGMPGNGFAAGGWWPAELGTPSSSGAQNDVRYAYFPASRRLAIQHEGRMELYDTGDHRIIGVSQQQGGGIQSPTFSSDKGDVRLADLRLVGSAAQALAEPQPAAAVRSFARSAPSQPAPTHGAVPNSPASDDPLALIERLAALRQKGILSEEEFTAKKAELLGRL